LILFLFLFFIFLLNRFFFYVNSCY